MTNSLLKLGALAALTVLGSAAGFFACGTSSPVSEIGYYPFKISVDSLEASGQLTSREREELFFLRKGNELIFGIPKEVSEPRLKFRNFSPTIQNTIELKSNNPDILLCYFINTPYEDECKMDITTNRTLISIWPQNLRGLAYSAGVLDQAVAGTILRYELAGKIDDQPFSIMGRLIYDNTEQSRLAYDEKIQAQREAYGHQTRGNQALRGGIFFALALVLVATIWLVFRLKRSRR